MAEINLGDTVEDTISGFKGKVVGITRWIHGCNRMVVQPPVGKDGKLTVAENFDEPALKVLKSAPKKREKKSTGGPIPTPAKY